MNYKIAIPSYHRSDIISKKTLKFLNDNGINRECIYIFVADEEEYEKYKNDVPIEMYNTIVIGELGVSNQRNFIRQYFNEGDYIISIDDDIEGLLKLNDDDKLQPLENIDEFFNKSYKSLKDHNLFMWGIYPVRNQYFMSKKVTTDLKFIIGCFYGFINDKDLKLSGFADCKEDIELTVLHYLKYGYVLRYNNITVKTKFLSKGGLGDEKQRLELNNASALYLEGKYPDLLKLYYRKNKEMMELKFKKQKKIN